MSAPKHEWRARLMRELGETIWDDPDLLALPQDQQDAIETITERAAQQLCAVIGHSPTQDHCGIPAHDYCLWCQTPTPNARGGQP